MRRLRSPEREQAVRDRARLVRRRLGLATLCSSALLFSHPIAAQRIDSSALPLIEIRRPTVIAFWEAPASDSVLMADPDLASALDEQQYYWAETRDRLEALGLAAVDQPGRRFRLRDQDGERLFAAPRDSAVVGYILIAPGRPHRVIYRVQYPDALLAAARRFFDVPQRPEEPPSDALRAFQARREYLAGQGGRW